MKRVLPALSILALLFAGAPSYAAPIATGTLSLTGRGQIEFGSTFVNFLCSGLGGACPAQSGDATVTATSGDFAIPGTTSASAFIRGIDAAVQPINAVFLLPLFVTFDPPADGVLDLWQIRPGVGAQADCLAAPAAGQTCTPIVPALATPANPMGWSWWTFENNAGGGSTGTIEFFSHGRRVSTGEVAPILGTITASFDVPFQDYVTLLQAGGAFRGSYVATFTGLDSAPTVPEPSSMLLLATGILGVRAARKRAR